MNKGADGFFWFLRRFLIMLFSVMCTIHIQYKMVYSISRCSIDMVYSYSIMRLATRGGYRQVVIRGASFNYKYLFERI